MDASQRLRTGAAEVAALRTLEGLDETLRARRDELRAWQAGRLAFTHADLLASPRYRQATRFFLDELYGAKDFSQRDAELARVIPTLTRFMPAAALETIADAVELDALSERLDLATARALVADASIRGRPIDDEAYARAFRAAGSRTDRERQVELVEHIGRALDRHGGPPLPGGPPGAMETPARPAGEGGGIPGRGQTGPATPAPRRPPGPSRPAAIVSSARSRFSATRPRTLASATV